MKQKESTLQRSIISSLNQMAGGYYFRIRNGSTFDPKIGRFRANVAEPGIPDICGFTKSGKAAFIEVKFVEKIENKKKLVCKIKITQEQKDFLYRAYKAGCLAGVAFNLSDAIAIVANDQELYPRHPRTFSFLPEEDQLAYAERYKEEKAKFTELNKDPLAKILWASKPQSQ